MIGFVHIAWEDVREAGKLRNGKLHHPSYSFISKYVLVIISSIVFQS